MLIGLGATFLTSRVRADVSNAYMPHTFSPFFSQFFFRGFFSLLLADLRPATFWPQLYISLKLNVI